MTNSELLRQKVQSSGLKYKYIADNIGISTEALRRKIDNKNYFNAEEIMVLSEILALDIKEKEAIFFSNDVD